VDAERAETAQTAERTTRQRSLLPWIVAFKAFKTITLAGLGLTLLATRHGDPVDLLFRGALAVHLPVTSRLFERALDVAMRLTIGQQTALAVTAFGYAALMGTEGIGLHLRKPWARWFTIIATSSLVPIEVFEIARAVSATRIVILIANVAIVVYLARRKEIFE
jgi:uncharacterized membrane protein (DUF2068 family)